MTKISDRQEVSALESGDYIPIVRPSGADWLDRRVAGSGVVGDYVDFSETPHTGWDSIGMTTKKVYYKKVGKLVYVTFFLDGTSNAVTASFILPFAANASVHSYQVVIRAMDNGTFQVSYLNINAGTNVVSFHKDITSDSSTSWTADGYKKIMGQFFYEAAD